MSDPLSSLLGSKKKEEKAKPAAKPSTSLFGDPGLSGLGGLGGDNLLDVSAALGGARRNVGPGPPPFSSPPAASESRADISSQPSASASFSTPPLVTKASQPSPPPPRAGGGSVVSGLSSAAAQLANGATPIGPTSFDDQLEAEKVHITVKKCFLKVSNPLCEVPGRILCTNYRMKFQNVKGGLREEMKWMQEAKYFDVPMGTLEDLKVDSKTTVTGATEVSMRVSTKDCRLLHFLMTNEEDCREVLSAVAAFAHPGNSTLLFATKYCEEYRKTRPSSQELDGWNLYDPVTDYARMGVDTDVIGNPSCPWKVSSLNTSYGLCSTYPSVLVLPRRMGEQEIRAVANFRKRGRLPALSWCGGPELNYASVWRCSQTTEGLMGTKCLEDEKHVQCIRQGLKSPTDRDLLVIDLRPWKAAWANKAGGGGFEGYPRCKLVFGGIDNIHAVRDAWRAMISAVGSVVEGEVGSWMKDVANSCWYDYIGAIMNCARKVIVEILDYRSNVMVHCSDGWDRTAQTSSLAMLCIDPYYRTQAGFLKLIQKEWCAFGHKFRTRLALGEAPTSESSPVFVQWLESVFQIVSQAPNIFEFTPAILLRLASEVTSNRYGTFLCDCEQKRHSEVASHTLSLWSILLSPAESTSWWNPSYRPSDKPFVPTVSQACFTIWEAYWFRFHPRGQRLRSADMLAAPGYAPAVPVAEAPAPAAAEPLMADSAPRGASDLPSLAEPLGLARSTSPPRESNGPAGDSLFSTEELESNPEPAPKAPPKQYFQDDDDEDVFAKAK